MGTLTLPSREILQQQDDEAWQRYGDACLDPRFTEQERTRRFELALASMAMLLEHDRMERGK